MKGTIIKHVRGIYYVNTEAGIITCKARGLFREIDISPIVGDKVEIRISEEDNSGYIEKVYPRSSRMIRPQVANVDMALIVFSLINPDINTYLLDKYLIMTEYLNIDSCILFTKEDITDNEKVKKYKDIYENSGYKVFVTGIDNDLNEIEEMLRGKITALAGPSGVGKTSLINRLIPTLDLETSAISTKTRRGRHTTRHVELIPIDNDTYILDTPGFSVLDLDFIEDESGLAGSFREFRKFNSQCQFNNCKHINEPKCGIKDNLGTEIEQSRYDSYLQFCEEINENRRY
ncbi:MAG: ribosome small subunit-dependent GTPase A [Tissierellia bacterium]|nr:ribosome small subunit-dependent GTPase A [Tissierellia bacterium]